MNATPSRNPKDLVQPAVQANKEHQYALKVYTERLEAELEHLDKLLAATEVSGDEDEEVLVSKTGGAIFVPGAVKPRGPVSMNDLMDESSPFFHEAVRRQFYEELTISHSMKGQELDALADAVRSENYRLHALEAQARGLPPFLGTGDEPSPDFSLNKEGIDWDRVAQKVSSASTGVQRTAKECEIRWLGERHPQFNDSQWTQSEVAKVRQLVENAREGEVDWVEIAQKLGTGRTPVDCLRHAIVRKLHTWTPEADRRLLEAINIHGTDNWGIVARLVSEDATASQCQNRYVRTLDPSLKRGPWTAEEDDRLRRAVDTCGKAWVEVAQYVDGRNSEQCRDRYQEYLNPSLTRGRWTQEQDAALVKAVEQVGEGKWKEVSKVLNTGRTDNMCRMRYTLITKQRKSTGSPAPAPEDRAASRELSFPLAGPSRSVAAPSRRPTPAADNAPDILILHPESYRPRSGTGTPVPTSAPTTIPPITPVPIPTPPLALAPPAPTMVVKPKPKPRPRAKKAVAAGEQTTEPITVPEGDSGTASTVQSEQTTLQIAELIDEHEHTGSESLRSVEGEPPNKRRRTAEPSSVAASAGVERESSHTAREEMSMQLQTPEAGYMSIDLGDAAGNQITPSSQETQSTRSTPDAGGGSEVSTAVRERGRGRGRGRGRDRPRGRGRGRPHARSPMLLQDNAEGSASANDRATTSAIPVPTRRQPPRTANRSQPSMSSHETSPDS
ncbi:hypothetical protein C8Q74DRAFT_1200630 [Fomes fomentarius]|nr:hypothetical protein C8Q74DRAFT_1200630 [Fomes fomentarius]